MYYFIIVRKKTCIFYSLFKEFTFWYCLLIHILNTRFQNLFFHLLNCPYMFPLCQNLNKMKIKVEFFLIIYICNINKCMKEKTVKEVLD